MSTQKLIWKDPTKLADTVAKAGAKGVCKVPKKKITLMEQDIPNGNHFRPIQGGQIDSDEDQIMEREDQPSDEEEMKQNEM